MTRYGLERVRSGLYRHAGGQLILRTDGWGRSERAIRWEHASEDRDGSLVVDGYCTYRTLRDAAADADRLSQRAR